MTEQNSNRLLVIDDEEGICEFVAEVATDLGFSARLTTRVEDFRAEFKDFDPTIIVMDLQMPDIDGIELLRELASLDCQAQIVLISGMDTRVLSTAEHLGKSLGLKMLGILCKPILLNTDISICGYSRIYEDGSYFGIATNPEWERYMLAGSSG